jgi:hypothetical protein
MKKSAKKVKGENFEFYASFRIFCKNKESFAMYEAFLNTNFQIGAICRYRDAR